MYEDDSIWARKGATLSDKSARQEFGLTQQEIFAAMRAGKLQFRETNMHGNPVVSAVAARSRSPGQREERAGSPAQEEAPKGVGRPQQGNPEAQNSLGCH